MSFPRSAAPYRLRPRPWRWLLLVSLLLSVVAAARPHRAKKSAVSVAAANKAELLRKEGTAALAAKDYPAAARLLTQSYRLEPGPEPLLELGLLAIAEGRLLDAHDLLGRYLSDPDLEPSSQPLPAPAQQLLADKPPPHARLSLVGDRGTEVLLDGRLVGVLPLSQPLLISPSEHKLAFEGSGQHDEDTLRIAAGHVGEFRYSRSPRAMLLSELPAILLVDDYGVLPAVQLGALQKIVDRTILHARLAPIPHPLAIELAAEPSLASCTQALDCNLQLARKLAADYQLRLRLRPTTPSEASACQVELELVDSEIGDAAARLSRALPSCGVEATAAQLGEALAQLLSEGLRRPRGKLELDSIPSGAELLLGERRLGITPFRGPLWAGELELTLRLDGYLPTTKSVQIPNAETAKLELELAQPVEPPPAALLPPPPPPPPPLRRKRWPLILGGALLGAGILVGAFGVSGVYAGAQTYSDTGIQRHPNAEPAGKILLGSGLALSAAGALILGITLSRPPWKTAPAIQIPAGTSPSP